jgi:HEAT repeat protein
MASIEELSEKLKHKDPDVRRRTVHNLMEIGGQKVKPYLRKALEDENADVKIAAIDSFVKNGDEDDLPYLKKIADKDSSYTLREAANFGLNIIKKRMNQNK